MSVDVDKQRLLAEFGEFKERLQRSVPPRDMGAAPARAPAPVASGRPPRPAAVASESDWRAPAGEVATDRKTFLNRPSTGVEDLERLDTQLRDALAQEGEDWKSDWAPPQKSRRLLGALALLLVVGLLGAVVGYVAWNTGARPDLAAVNAPAAEPAQGDAAVDAPAPEETAKAAATPSDPAALQAPQAADGAAQETTRSQEAGASLQEAGQSPQEAGQSQATAQPQDAAAAQSAVAPAAQLEQAAPASGSEQATSSALTAPPAAAALPPPAAAKPRPAATHASEATPPAEAAPPSRAKPKAAAAPKPKAHAARPAKPKHEPVATRIEEPEALPQAQMAAPVPAPQPAPAPAPSEPFSYVKRAVNSVTGAITDLGRSAIGARP